MENQVPQIDYILRGLLEAEAILANTRAQHSGKTSFEWDFLFDAGYYLRKQTKQYFSEAA